jgi:hypothetical protein
MAIYVVKTSTIIAAPSDTNDGKDPFGFAVTDGTYFYDVAEDEWILQKTGAFAGYTRVAGDIVNVSSAADGVAGWFEVKSKESDNEIRLGPLVHGTGTAVPPVSALTDAATSDGPFATVLKLPDVLQSGLHFRICADGVHELTARFEASQDNMFVYGVGARGSGLAQAAIKVVHTDSGVLPPTFNFGGDCLVSHLSIDYNNTDRTVLGPDGTSAGVTYHNLHIFNVPSNRDIVRPNRNLVSVIGCRFSGGRRAVDAYGGSCVFVGNVIEGFSEWGIGTGNTTIGTEMIVKGNIIANGSGDGIRPGRRSIIDGNNVYNVSGSGVRGNSQDHMIGNTVSGCGGYGYVVPATFRVFAFNHSHGNTSGHTNLVADGDWPDFGHGDNVTGDPLFRCIIYGEDFAWTAATSTLSKTGKFAGASVGDEIRVTGGTGVTPGYYEIATVVDDNSVTLTTSMGASDATDVELEPDFTPAEGSPLRNAGINASDLMGVSGSQNIGVVQDPYATQDAPAAGTGINRRVPRIYGGG